MFLFQSSGTIVPAKTDTVKEPNLWYLAKVKAPRGAPLLIIIVVHIDNTWLREFSFKYRLWYKIYLDIISYVPMSKFELKQKVFSLRRVGNSLLDISRTLNISKSTVAFWCREIELTLSQQQTLKEKMIREGHKGRLLGAAVNKQKKVISQLEAGKQAKGILGNINERDRLVAGIALYWAEGSKAPSTTGFVFVNSDPVMIKFIYDWLVDIIKVQKDQIFLQISINEIHRYRIDKVLNFWSNLLDLPQSSFSKTFFAKSIQKKVYENHEIHYGVLRLGVRKSSFLKYKVLHLIDILKCRRSSGG